MKTTQLIITKPHLVLASTAIALLALTPMIAFAQLVSDTTTGGEGNAGEFGTLLINIVGFINTILIPFILALAFLAFVWGVFQYFIAGGANDESKEKGKSLMVYAVAGFVLILAFWGIINLLATSTGLDDKAGVVDERVIDAPTPTLDN